jgi:hypothetical protein
MKGSHSTALLKKVYNSSGLLATCGGSPGVRYGVVQPAAAQHHTSSHLRSAAGAEESRRRVI